METLRDVLDRRILESESASILRARAQGMTFDGWPDLAGASLLDIQRSDQVVDVRLDVCIDYVDVVRTLPDGKSELLVLADSALPRFDFTVRVDGTDSASRIRSITARGLGCEEGR